MKRKPMKYNSTEDEVVLKLTSRSDKKGNVFFMVEYGDDDYVCFAHLSSALDYIQTNFRP